MPDYNKKFSIQRPYPPSNLETLHRASESDRGRIINSAAVRRLQQKTQVFPLERNAAVRSRLTHSLEVQQTGRFIVQTLCRQLRDENSQHPLLEYERLMETMVEMACLMHDIGNPPFGHFGEAAISGWFRAFLEDVPTLTSPALRHELASFEGNAQAIRLISNLQRLNLTYAQAACVLKYTRLATEEAPADDDRLCYLKKKPGYYVSELDYVREMREVLDMQPGHRYPLTYLMEAADDISYCLADMEDGVDKNIISYPQLSDYLRAEFYQLCEKSNLDAAGRFFNQRSFDDIVQGALKAAEKEPINKAHEFFVRLRVGLIHSLVVHAADEFRANIDAIFTGFFNGALLEDGSPCHQLIKTLKNVAIRRIFSVAEVETVELQGHQIIHGIFNHYKPLLQLSEKQFQSLVDNQGRKLLLESRLFRRLPPKHVKAYLYLHDNKPREIETDKESWELYCRCRLLQDMVSGMTDQFALDEFNLLSVRTA